MSYQPNYTDIPSTQEARNAITDYIRLRLGDQMVDVEADKEHYETAINTALMRYRQRAQNATEESYAFLALEPNVQEYILPKEVQVVKQIYRRGLGSVSSGTATHFEPFASGFVNTYMMVAGRVGGMANYQLFSMYQKDLMTMFGGYIMFNFSAATKKLTLMRKTFGGEEVMLHIFNSKPDQVLFADPFVFPWIQDYAYSMTKHMIGEAREKFASIAGPQGGGQLNGAALKTEANEEMKQLILDLGQYVDGSQPLTFIFG
jgi:hypothetical protein